MVTPYLQDPDLTLYNGDVQEVLAGLPDESVQMVVTSPPYWGLRDYGTGTWAVHCPTGVACIGCRYCETAREKADACDHQPPKQPGRIFKNGQGKAYASSNTSWSAHDETTYRDTCGKCGASRTDNQLGLEATPDEYVAKMVDVFREVRRVLRRDGTLWLNLGDSYAQGSKGNSGAIRPGDKQGTNRGSLATRRGDSLGPNRNGGTNGFAKPKDLLMIPARVALALQADGWFLRSEITWCKPNPMPESVTDRPTQATEKLYLFSRSPRYFYDAEAVREPHTGHGQGTKGVGEWNKLPPETSNGRGASTLHSLPGSGRNLRNWWEIATEPYPEAHFATYPQELVRRCILAGTSERGCCPECGAAWVREVINHGPDRPQEHERHVPGGQERQRGLSQVQMGSRWVKETTGWRPFCECRCPVSDVECVNGVGVSELPRGVRAEVGEPSAPTKVLQPELRGQVQCSRPAGTDEDHEGLHRSTPAGSSSGLEAGLCDGASSGDGAGTGAAVATRRSGPSPQPREGRQPRGELSGDAEAVARPGAEAAPASGSVPALSGADLDSGSVEADRPARGPAPAPVACVVLDPFFGSGTTGLVARKHGRRTVGIELSPEYCGLAARRLSQLSLLAEPA